MGSKCYGIGIGPGDPELLTVKAAALLRELDTIFIPETGNDRSRAELIIQKYLAPGSTVVPLYFSMAKSLAEREKTRREAGERVLHSIREGKSCGIVTLGDPMTYSTFTYVYRQLREAEIDVEVVPGVTSYHAAASMLGSELVLGSERFCVVSSSDNLDLLFDQFDTVVCMKISAYWPEVRALLAVRGLDAQFSVVVNGGFDDQQVFHGAATVPQVIPYLSTGIYRRNH